MASGAAIWGLLWIALRHLDNAGINGLWAIALVMASGLIPALLSTIWLHEWEDLYEPDTWSVGIALGMATVLYFVGVLYSDVIRVIFLFYLLPVWTTLSARIIYGEPVNRAQVAVMAAALCGVWLLLGGNSGLPVPQNTGDWCGLIAGMCWGVSLSLLRGREHTRPFASTTAALTVAMILATATALLLSAANLLPATGNDLTSPAPNFKDMIHSLPLAMVFGMAVLFPAMLAQIWGARRIPAPTAALLTMTEIIVATVSAALLVGTDLEPASLLGGAIIVAALLIDIAIRPQPD